MFRQLISTGCVGLSDPLNRASLESFSGLMRIWALCNFPDVH
jgi:hypothetical protein